jgi:hypothetical protein
MILRSDVLKVRVLRLRTKLLITKPRRCSGTINGVTKDCFGRWGKAKRNCAKALKA